LPNGAQRAQLLARLLAAVARTVAQDRPTEAGIAVDH